MPSDTESSGYVFRAKCGNLLFVNTAKFCNSANLHLDTFSHTNKIKSVKKVKIIRMVKIVRIIRSIKIRVCNLHETLPLFLGRRFLIFWKELKLNSLHCLIVPLDQRNASSSHHLKPSSA